MVLGSAVQAASAAWEEAILNACFLIRTMAGIINEVSVDHVPSWHPDHLEHSEIQFYMQLAKQHGMKKKEALSVDSLRPTEREDGAEDQQPTYPTVREKTDLLHHLPYQLVHVSQLLHLGVSRLFQSRFGLGIREWRVLAILGYYGPLNASDLVGRAASDKATVSRAVSQLEKNGYVTRVAHPSDARRRLIHLTEAGADLHDRVAPISRLRRRVLEAALTGEERDALAVILDKLRAQLEWLNEEEANDMAGGPEAIRETDGSSRGTDQKGQ